MKTIQLLFFLFVCQFGNSQTFSVKWGTDFRLTSGIFENNIYLKSIPTGKGGAISVFVKKESFKTNNDFILAKINSKAQIESHLELPFVNNLKEGFLDIVKLQNSFFILKYRFISDEKAQLVVNRLDADKFVIEKEEKLIGELEASEKRGPFNVFAGGSLYLFNASVHYSPDSSKLVIINDPFQKRKSTKKVNLLILNNDLSKTYATEFTFSSPYNKTLVRSNSITNEGKVVVLYNIYEKDYQMMFYGNGDKIPLYTSHMLVVDETKKNNITINTSDKFLHSAHISYSETGSPLLLGFYKDKHDGRLSGAIRANINMNADQTGTISNIKFKAFDEDLLKKIDRDNQGQKDGKNPGLDNDFFVNQLLCVDNGFNSIVLEYFNTISHSNGAVETTKGNLIISSFLPDGNIVFQLIPRKQKTPNQAGSSNLLGPGFYTIDYFKDNMILFYNDKDENIYKNIDESPEKFGEERNSALVVAALSANGKLKTRKIVYTHEGMDGFVTNLNFTKITDNTYLVYTIKAGALKHALKAGIITMK
jgi:hypothetical protein